MKTLLMKVAPISVLLTLGASGAAWAHVVVEPEEVEAGGYEKFTAAGTVLDTDGVNPAFLYGLPALGVASLVAALAALRKRA